MTNFIGKSTHPVQVKKVSIRIWTLRDEIEAAIAKRLSEEEHSEDNPADISDIKAFYQNILDGTAVSNANESNDDNEDEANSENLDPSGNPMDDDAAAMLAAMGGGEAEVKEEDQAKAENEEKPAEVSEEDVEAAKLAAEMLDGQTDDKAQEPSEEDDEAARLAAEMLEGQTGDAPASEEKKELDKALVKPKKERAPFERVLPHKSKIATGYVLLADVFMDQILIFCDQTFTIGQNLVIEFLVTKPFSVTAELNISQDIGRYSKIIKEVKYSHRLQCVFLFQFPGERANLRNFLQAVEPDIPSPPKKMKKSDAGDDEEFDDLGF